MLLQLHVIRQAAALWQVMGHKRLLETNADIILQQKINLRAPYVTPLNVLQACNSPRSPCCHTPSVTSSYSGI